MANNVIPFPSPERPLDTPESAQECLNLAKLIDEQMDRWTSYSHHPRVRLQQGSIAKIISTDSQPLDHEPVDYFEQAGFGGTMSREDAKQRIAYERRRQVLSKWALLETIDDYPAENEGIVEFIDLIKDSAEHPGVPEEYRFAIRALRRLYIVRERLAGKIGRVSTLDISQFAQLATRIGDDLN